MKRRSKKKLSALLVVTVAAGVLGALPASADCLAAEVYYQRPGQTRQYVGYGPKECVTPNLPGGQQGVIVGPVGEPSIINVGTGVWVPVP